MDRMEKCITENIIYSNIIKSLFEDVQTDPNVQPAQPVDPKLLQQQELDQYGNPLGYENPITKGIDDFAIKKAQVYDTLTDKLKEKIAIKN